MCLCAVLEPVDNQVRVHILQHPRERRHALNTARLLRLGLSACEVHVLSSQEKSVACKPLALGPRAGLLYPSPGSRDLNDLRPAERPDELVVIDGTWAQANRMHRDNPWLAALPSYRLTPTEGSRYRIREEPRLECLSTVESVVAALRQLEPDLVGLERLDSAFDRMIDDQIAAAAANPSTHARGQRPRRRMPKPVPAALLSADACFILAYTEAEPLRPGDDSTARAPIRISAVASDAGSPVFDAVVQTRHAPSAFEAGVMELKARDFDNARPHDIVVNELQDFCLSLADGRPIVLLSWGTRTLAWLDHNLRAGRRDIASVLLKGVWANVARRRVPDLEVVVAELGLKPVPLPIAGRAGRRLSCARAMLKPIQAAGRNGPTRA